MDNVVQAPGQRLAAEDAFNGLRVGDRLTGRVLQLEADGRVLIDLGRFRALARTTMPVQPGQVMSLKVARSGVPLQLKVDGVETLPNQRPLPRLALGTLLAEGDRQRLAGVVDRLLTALPRTAVDAKAGGAVANARSDVGATAATASTPSTASAQGQMTPAVAHALEQLKGLFAAAPTESSAQQWQQWVRTVVEDRGVLFEVKLAEALATKAPSGEPRIVAENRTGVAPADIPEGPVRGAATGPDALARAVQSIFLRDLKPQLLLLQSFLGEPERAASRSFGLKEQEVSFLRQTVSQLLHHVEHQQERAVQRAGGGELFHVLAHLVPMEEGRRPVAFKVYYPKRGGGDGTPGHRIALLLDMDRLGPVRVDLTMVANDLGIQFHVRDEAVKQRIETHTNAVVDALAGHFDHVQVTARVSREAIARFGTEDQEGPAVGRIDIKA
ncbi:flagellar hook-length control protein FliK [Desulfatitalea alkaliphila]|uniref:Flagellar hook-length control protein FliK n=1 Tax=Desulfatitalea alkaliphila TaxID=2929485 RepID=A0AA41R1R4_9BACT|nr:flagellar hook-length control protein FliK [Desulfatitalea alkaliphila]MCJ8500557.1 flagellar hook-length control protein FliK [Desulfatitalea alkaliphila]